MSQLNGYCYFIFRMSQVQILTHRLTAQAGVLCDFIQSLQADVGRVYIV
jgi:hypothetical protein